MTTNSVGTLVMKGVKSGRSRTLSVYSSTALAAGNYVLVDWNAPAGANSPNFFTVPSGEEWQITDFLPTAATGQVEFTSDGSRTNVVLDYSTWAASNPSRPVSALPKLRPGVMYRLLVVVVLAT
jgi:hypothetical protein